MRNLFIKIMRKFRISAVEIKCLKLELEKAQEEIEGMNAVYVWFLASVWSEYLRLLKLKKRPTKIYLKYPMSPDVAAICVPGGILRVVVDSNIKGLFKLK